MQRNSSRFICTTLAATSLVVVAGCSDALPTDVPAPQFSQGAKGTLTVNSLEDGVGGTCTQNSCTLRQAIAASVPGDRIVFKNNLSGTIHLSAGQMIIIRDVTIDGGGRITIDAQGESRVFMIFANVEIAGLVITGGRAFNPENSYYQGGAILNHGKLTLRRATLSGNGAEYGGAVYSEGVASSITLLQSTISGNSAVTGGGVYMLSGTARMEDTRIADNQGGFFGGGIYNNSGTLDIAGGVIANNTARNGGGLLNTGTATLSGVLVTRNSATAPADFATDGGAGIHNLGPNSTLALRLSTLAFNTTTASGGGIRNDQGIVTVERSTISGNEAAVYGSALMAYTGQIHVRSSTITRNSSIRVVDGGTQGITLFNSIIAGNDSNGCSNTTSLGHNIVEPSGILSCASDMPSDVRVGAGLTFIEVLEPDLRDHGGPTPAHALIERGRAVDAGYCPGELTDQRGFPRPYDDPRMPNRLDGCDVGALEWQPPPPPTKGKRN